MPRKLIPAEVNSFVRGLITEASPLTFPDNASLDEVNFILNKDGSRNRRLGMDFKVGAASFNSTVSVLDNLAISAFKWENVGGDPTKTVLVVQVGVNLYGINGDDPFSAPFTTWSNIGTDETKVIQMTSVDGLLVCATGSGNLTSIEYSNGTYTTGSFRLKVRDLFGVEDITSGQDLLSSDYLDKRPSTLTDAHLYNLRNQTFAIPRFNGSEEVLTDTVRAFYTSSGSTSYPANSDSIIPYFYSLPNDGENREVERYDSYSAHKNPLGSFRAPMGFFVIDAMSRGTSRISNLIKLKEKYPSIYYEISSLPLDSTPGGASVVEQFAGRVFYAGFSGEVNSGDKYSPRLSSYVLFSQKVNSTSDLGRCYQEGDPTSKETPDIIATDGGFIRIDGAYGIRKLVNVGNQLLVFAQNGVWSISGGNDYGFSADNYLVKRYSDHGVLSSASCILVDNTVLYWGDDAIYHASPDQYGEWKVTNLTATTIQSLYDDIETTSKLRCRGFYDSYERKVRWLYDNDIIESGVPVKELILDLNLNAFSIMHINRGASNRVPIVGVEVPPFKAGTISTEVVVGGVSVEAATVPVEIISIVEEQQLREFVYLTIDSYTGTYTITFKMASYYNPTFKDWDEVDAEAYMLTGYISGGDFQRYKQVPYLTTHFKRTETGFDVNFNLTNQSSCLIQSRWEWTDSANSGMWGREFEAYRIKRHWIPASIASEFDNGFPVVSTRNKLRGKGKVLSLLFKTSPGKDLHMYGWSMILGINNNV